MSEQAERAFEAWASKYDRDRVTADVAFLAGHASRDAEVAALRDALEKLACWQQGHVVNASFDCPWAARIARDALLNSPPDAAGRVLGEAE